jgi:ATP-dependent DNA helicase RecG
MQKKDASADFLLMSATPIPQSLAKTLYGDLDVVTIDARPHGREPVSTHLVPDHKRQDMIRFIRETIIDKGEQAFWVVPRIDQVEEHEQIRDVSGVLEELQRGLLHDVPVGAVHGRMSTEETAEVMGRYSSGELKVLVATTVVEVGIDVPAATTMIIENAERFGLAQLHQLRGRVGRAAGSKGFCFLLANQTEDGAAQERLKRFCTLHDGFALAELDLQLRGPGEVAGHRQSGWEDFRMADILRDAALFREIQKEIESILGS